MPHHKPYKVRQRLSSLSFLDPSEIKESLFGGNVSYTVNPDGTLDVDGGLRPYLLEPYVKDGHFILQFGKVSGNFSCFELGLTSLEGAPRTVGGDFSCENNSLTTLEGAPHTVGGYFNCSYNRLTSLEGSPSFVGSYFDCSYNNLTTLEGASRFVGGYFDCKNNLNLKSLDGLKDCKIRGRVSAPNLSKPKITPQFIEENRSFEVYDDDEIEDMEAVWTKILENGPSWDWSDVYGIQIDGDLNVSECPLTVLPDGSFDSENINWISGDLILGNAKVKSIHFDDDRSGIGGSLDGFGNSPIESVSIGQLAIVRDIDLSNCPKLETFEFESRGSLDIDLSNCKSLKEVSLEMFQADIGTLDLSGCSNLKTLHINPDSDGIIRTLNLTGCTSLDFSEEDIASLKEEISGIEIIGWSKK